jgi:hypothetical protein
MRSYTINIIPGYAADPSVRVSQYDKNYPIYFTVMDGDSEKDLTDTTAYFSMLKPDGTKAYEECAISDGKVILFVTPQMSAAAGAGLANITLTKGTKKESTSQFAFIIESAAAPVDYFSDYEMNYYEDVISRIENMMLDAADIQSYATAAAQSASAAQTSAAQAQAIAMDGARACFPVGTILMTTENVNPSTYIGGTWVALNDVFLFAASETHPAGETGGSETVALKTAQMPRHNHFVINMSKGTTSPDYLHTVARSDFEHSQWENARYQLYGVDAEANSGKSSYVGSGAAHDNMPPYLTVYMWKRTA